MSTTTNKTANTMTATTSARAKSYLVDFGNALERVKAFPSAENENEYITVEETSRTFTSEQVRTNTLDKITTSNDFDYVIVDFDDYKQHSTCIRFDNVLNVSNMYELELLCEKCKKHSTYKDIVKYSKKFEYDYIKQTFVDIAHASFINAYKRDKTIEIVLSPIDAVLMLNSDYADLVQDCERKDERKQYDSRVISNAQLLKKSIVVDSVDTLKSVLKTICVKTDINTADALETLSKRK